MLAPREQVDPYLIETKNEQTLKFTKTDADNVAQNMQAAGRDVEVYHKGMLQYRLSGIYQGNLFQQ
jgi:hypothetical protein|tara:strand:+ start:93 stop:290 length:198 start_codon:yes stop_codon:yes gene_type:complete